MLKHFNLRAVAVTFLALLGLSLAGCNQLAKLAGPNHQFILQVHEQADGNLGAEANIEALLEASIPVLTGRLEAMGVTVTSATKDSDDRLIVNVAGENSRNALATAIGRSAKLDFKLVNQAALLSDTIQGIAPPGSVILPTADGSQQIAILKLGGINGDHVVNAAAMLEAYTEEHVVNMRFDDRGSKQLAELTAANVGKPLAIILDDEVIAAPNINEPILGGSLQLAGNFTAEEANELAIMVRSGALPVALEIVEERTLD